MSKVILGRFYPPHLLGYVCPLWGFRSDASLFAPSIEQAGTQAWAPLEGATVHADTDYTTGTDGTAAISVDHDATLQVFAEKDDFIRSDKIMVTVGSGIPHLAKAEAI